MEQLFLIIGSIALLVCVGCLIALHILPTGFHPMRDPVSNYALSKYGQLYRIQAFASGICAGCLVMILNGVGIIVPTAGSIALSCYAISRILIPNFPTDLPPQRTRTGQIHIILAVVTFAGIATATGILTGSLIHNTIWGAGILQFAAILTQVSAVAFLVVIFFRPLRAILGLVERGIYLGTIMWLGVVLTMISR